MEEAKAFVESFKPLDLCGAEGVSVEPEVRPAVEPSSSVSAAVPAPPDESAVAKPQPKSAVSHPEHEPHVMAAPNSSKRWWEFWK